MEKQKNKFVVVVHTQTHKLHNKIVNQINFDNFDRNVIFFLFFFALILSKEFFLPFIIHVSFFFLFFFKFPESFLRYKAESPEKRAAMETEEDGGGKLFEEN